MSFCGIANKRRIKSLITKIVKIISARVLLNPSSSHWLIYPLIPRPVSRHLFEFVCAGYNIFPDLQGQPIRRNMHDAGTIIETPLAS
jgi:hypothetical protein